MTVTLHHAETEADYNRLEALARDIWTEHYGPLLGMAQVDYMLDKFQSATAMQESGYTYLVALADGVPAGYCAYGADDNGLFISKLYVRRENRRQHVGKVLLDACLAFGAAAGAQTAWLTVNKYNTASIAVYEKLGFAVTADVVADIGGGYIMDDYKMERAISL